MVITVKFLGSFRSFSEKEKITLEIKGRIMLKDIVKELIKKSPKLKKVLIDPELKDPRPNALILVNGKEISILKGLETMLNEGDEILLIPVIHGG